MFKLQFGRTLVWITAWIYEFSIFQKRTDRPWRSYILLLDRYRDYFSGVKRPGHKADYSSASSVEVKNEWRYNSTPSMYLCITGETRRKHNEEHNNLYCSPSFIRVIKSRRRRRAEHVAGMWERRDAYKVLVGMRPLGRHRCRWEDNIKIYLQQVGWGLTKLIWLRIGTGGGLLYMWLRNFGSQKMEEFLE